MAPSLGVDAKRSCSAGPGGIALQDLTRPSESVVAIKPFASLDGLIRVRVTLRDAAGRPVIVSSTWQVIGDEAIVTAMFPRWDDIADMRWAGVVVD
jgi:hypothetical protein